LDQLSTGIDKEQLLSEYKNLQKKCAELARDLNLPVEMQVDTFLRATAETLEKDQDSEQKIYSAEVSDGISQLIHSGFAKHRELFDSFPVGLAILSTLSSNLSISYCNDAYCQMMGYSREELIGQTCEKFFGDKSNRLIVEQLYIASKNREAFQGNIVFYRKDGSHFLNNMTIVPISIPGFDEPRLLTIQFDTKSMIAGNEFLLASPNYMDAVLRTTDKGIVILDGNGDLKFLNESCEKIFDTTFEALQKKSQGERFENVWDFDGNELGKEERPFEVMKKEGRNVRTFRLKIKTPKENIKFIQSTGYPILNSENKFDGVVYCVEDVSIESKKDAQLIQANHVLEKVSTVLSDYISEGDPFEKISEIINSIVTESDSDFACLAKVSRGEKSQLTKPEFFDGNGVITDKRYEFEEIIELFNETSQADKLAHSKRHINCDTIQSKNETSKYCILSYPLIYNQVVDSVVLFIKTDCCHNQKLPQILDPLLNALGSLFSSYQTSLEKDQFRSLAEESEHRFRTLFYNSIDPMIVMSIDQESLGKIIEVNDAFAKMHGYTLEELKTKTIGEIDTPEHAEKVPERIIHLIENGNLRFEVDHHDKQGNVLTFDVTATSITLHGKAYGLSVMRDITERRRNQREREILTTRLVTATSAAGLGVWEFNFVTGEISRDEKTYELWGLGKVEEDPSFDSVYEIIHPDDRDGEKERFQKALTSDIVTYQSEFRIVRPDNGEIRYLHSFAKFVRDENGKALNLTGINYDTTDARIAEKKRLELEKQMLQTQKLESLGVMAGGIAHDFNNLLVAILGNVQIAKMDLVDNEELVSLLDEVELQAHRASELCQQMLAYSGVGKFQSVSFNLDDLIIEMKKLIGVSISKRVTVQYDLSGEVLFAKGDPTQIRQILLNLLMNASDAIGDRNGEILVTSGKCELHESMLQNSKINFAHDLKTGDYVYFRVKDSGHGMNEKTLSKIFDPFFSTKFTGRGLGLAAALGILKAHEGAVTVDSIPEKGTTFTVYLPEDIQGRLESDSKVANLKFESGNKYKLLIIDDEKPVLNVCQKILKKRGHEVVQATTGSQGIELFAENHQSIDCVLLDMTMPQMSGEEVLEELLKIDPDLRVIVMSGYHKKTISERFTLDKIKGFLHKPFNMEELLELVQEVLGQ